MKWLIWSIEHGGWWKFNGNGYTKVRAEAHRYDFEAAKQIVEFANACLTGDTPNEAMCPDWLNWM